MSIEIERDYIRANISSLEAMINRLGKGGALARRNLESRRKELLAKLEEIGDVSSRPLASVSLFFGGEPIVSNRGIESEFAGAVIEGFQDLVSKLAGLRQTKTGSLGERGVVPGKNSSTLHVTNVVRGSFGFQFEELPDQLVLQTNVPSTDLKKAVDEAAMMFTAFDVEDEGRLEEIVAEDIDARVFGSIKSFFDTVQSHGASFRIVCGDVDKLYSEEQIKRTASILDSTQVIEHTDHITGVLWGFLPDGRRFEFQSGDEMLKGTIAKSIPEETILSWRNLMPATADVRSKRVLRQGAVRRIDYVLEELQEAVSQTD